MSDVIFSDFGRKMTSDSGILQLMDDLGQAMNGQTNPVAMFGGGNPAIIPEVTDVFKQSIQDLVADSKRLSQMLGVYDTPQGNAQFIEILAEYFSEVLHTQVRPENIAITSGSQTGFFMLFNMLAGKTNGRLRKMLFPLVPEYIGYSDQLIEHEMITSQRPIITKIGKHEFKYEIDFEHLEINVETAAMCISRPTNPSGNVISDQEVIKLQEIAKEQNTPLIIDNAYGDPFPGVIDNVAPIKLDDNTVLSFSLSKLGLPSARTGIFVGPSKLMKALSSLNAIVALASPSFGQYLVGPLITSGKINEVTKKYIQPFYFERRQKAFQAIQKYFDDNLPWRLHTYQGSYFFWLWLEGSSTSSKELYNRLKDRGVVVVPGEYFFAGQNTTDWSHAHECLRLNFARPDYELDAGFKILAEEITRAYA